MAFENLKEQLRDQWADLSSKIQENPAFNTAREKFEGQPVHIQRLILLVFVVVVAVVVLSFPYAYISQSDEYMAEFEENRGLIQGLLRASRVAKEPSPLPPPIGADMLKTRVESILKQSGLVADQIGELRPMVDKPAGDLAPPVVQQAGLVVPLKTLNVSQIVSVSHMLQELGPGTKLMGVDIVQSPKQTHYYDIIARVVFFGLPVSEVEVEEPPMKGGKGRAKPKPTEEEAE